MPERDESAAYRDGKRPMTSKVRGACAAARLPRRATLRDDGPRHFISRLPISGRATFHFYHFDAD